MADHSAEPDPDARVTSPMQEFTGGQALTGGIVLLIVGLNGLLILGTAGVSLPW